MKISNYDKQLESFVYTPVSEMGYVKWVWNASADGMEDHELEKQLRKFRDTYRYRGVMIVLDKAFRVSDDNPYLEKYRICMKLATELGMKVIMHMESAPVASSIEKIEMSVFDSCSITMNLSGKDLLGVVAMNLSTLERQDLSDQVSEGILQLTLPDGIWRIMAFSLSTMDESRYDLLDIDAVHSYMERNCVRNPVFSPDLAGDTIQYGYINDTSLWYPDHGQMWTRSLTEEFTKQYGYSPVLLYPALWYDIGEETASARNALFGLRTETYSEKFIRPLAAWHQAQGMQLMGHQDHDRTICQLPISGDLMKLFKYQHIPGISENRYRNRSSQTYKLISSAAYNYDLPLVMAECFSGTGGKVEDYYYREIMDMFTKGINMTIESEVTYRESDNHKCDTPSGNFENPNFTQMADFHTFCGRLSYMLKGGRHVADIGILYPAATLQAGYHFSDDGPNDIIQSTYETNYLEIGEMLSHRLHRDFTYIHPEIMDEKCKVSDNLLVMENDVNREEYKVMIIADSRVVSLSNLELIHRFYASGGSVLFTGVIPYKSTEPGQDEAVQRIVQDMTGIMSYIEVDLPYTINKNKAGGTVICLGNLNVKTLSSALDMALDIYDVSIDVYRSRANMIGGSARFYEWSSKMPKGNLSYIHKLKDGLDVLYLANSCDIPLFCDVTMRGKLYPEIWNPHDGTMEAANFKHVDQEGTWTTEVDVKLAHITSLFLVARAQ